MRSHLPTALLASVLLAAGAARAQADKQPLRLKLKDDIKGQWHYDDAPAGFAEAKKTGKPLLVVFRCVP